MTMTYLEYKIKKLEKLYKYLDEYEMKLLNAHLTIEEQIKQNYETDKEFSKKKKYVTKRLKKYYKLKIKQIKRLIKLYEY